MQDGNQREKEHRRKASDAPDRCERPAYKCPDRLAAAYEAENESIKATASQFDASYCTVRGYLIEYGIHEPQERAEMSTAARLEDSDPEDFGLSPLEGGA